MWAADMDLDLPEKRIEKFLFVHLKLKRLFKGRQFDNVILQYPFYSVFLTKKIIENAKALNPDIEVMVRARNNDEALQLEKTGITGVFNDKEAAAESLAGAIYAHYAPKTEDE